ncbi:nitrate- and nitrite sensing domain-containing protein [Streptomyces sp. HMX112]|uniref:sensor histidine kinase n=1 Tax=Streptomyces sp. HMX112 TaxID=3390850 RepID=UPI003A80D7F5
MQKRSDTPGDPQAPGGRGVRVRSRLVAGVALVGITVLGAGAPAVLTASSELTDSQRLVTLAQLNRQAVTLAHSLADERDRATAYIAAGREDERTGNQDGTRDGKQDGGSDGKQDGNQDGQDGAGRNGAGAPDRRGGAAGLTARVDRQIDEIHPAAPDELRRDLATVPAVRRAALTGKGTAMEAHRAYTDIIAKLQALADELADRTPARATGAGTRAAAELGHAAEQASATRGLLLAALAVPGRKATGPVYDPVTGRYAETGDQAAEGTDRTRGALSAAAQQARVREQAALADFDQAAGPAARDRLAATVTGPEVKTAEGYLARLTDRPELSDEDRGIDEEKLAAALTARIEQMRGVESALATGEVQHMERLRDDDVTALELRIALLGGCLLVAIGVSTAVARTLTRPLAVLRIGAARVAAAPETEEPVRFTGRNDEFAQVVRSLNTLHGKLRDLAARAGKADGERADAVAGREALAAELATHRAELSERTAEVTAELERLRHSVQHTFVNLSLRTLGLVERQLAVIEKLEEREQDPERLATLFKLDHMATVMRRHSENLLVLAGHEHGHAHQGPVPLVDVARAAVSEIERYERVTIQSLPPHTHVAGFAADDLSHLVAELLENATAFSPPEAKVQLAGWLLESGEVVLSVQDEGIGMTEDRLAELNARLADPEPDDDDHDGEGLGIRVTALLAARHGVRVRLREQKQGGVAAVVVLPQSLLPEPPATAVGTAPALKLPGSVAEANSNALPGRAARDAADPLVAAAEAAIRETSQEPDPEPEQPEPERQEPERQEQGQDASSAPPAGPGEPTSETTLQVRVPEPPAGPAADGPPAEAAGLAADGPATGGPRAGGRAGAPAGPYAIGPDAHERAAEAPGHEDSHDRPGRAPESDGTERAVRAGAERPVDAGRPEAEAGQPGDAERPGRAPESDGAERPDPAAEQDAGHPGEAPRPAWERVTDKGLPKRTPRIVQAGTAPAERAGGVDAEALRARLGGFHQGALAGRRDVEAQLAEETQQLEAVGTEETGDTVEEARS